MKGACPMKSMNLLIFLLLMVMGTVCCTGCVATRGEVAVGVGYPQDSYYHQTAPPAYAPAPVRYKHRYWYYPDSYVYFDTARRVYFYLAGNAWRVSVSLPSSIQVNLNDRITLEMDTERPYSRFQEHRKKFPPGRKEKKKGKKK